MGLGAPPGGRQGGRRTGRNLLIEQLLDQLVKLVPLAAHMHAATHLVVLVIHLLSKNRDRIGLPKMLLVAPRGKLIRSPATAALGTTWGPHVMHATEPHA
jgi:hypothetical protein